MAQDQDKGNDEEDFFRLRLEGNPDSKSQRKRANSFEKVASSNGEFDFLKGVTSGEYEASPVSPVKDKDTQK